MKSVSGIGSAALLCADPLVARVLHDYHGFASKEALSIWLGQNVKVPVQQFWGNGVVSTIAGSLGAQGLEPYASWLKLPADSVIAPFHNPKAVNTVVVGGQTNTIWYITDFRLSKGILIDNWR